MKDIFARHKHFIGVVHLQPLPGSPRWRGDLEALIRFAVADEQNPPVHFMAALVKSILLGRRLKHAWKEDKMAGILLPPSVPGAASTLFRTIPYRVSARNKNE